MTTPPTILLVDDSRTQLAWMARALESEGFRTQTFTRAEDALEHLRQHPPPAAIVTDMHMPGIDGWRFCRLVRSPEFQPVNGVPILAVSAMFAGATDADMTRGLGADR